MIPKRVDDISRYWQCAPFELSPRCLYWLDRIHSGFSPNKRLRGMGYYEAAQWYGVYIWEWFNVIRPALDGRFPDFMLSGEGDHGSQKSS